MSEALLLSTPMFAVAALGKTITFGQANYAAASSLAFTSIPEGDIAVVLACSSSWGGSNYLVPAPPISGLWTTLHASTVSTSHRGIRLGYRVAGVGGLATTESWGNAELIGVWTASNPRKTWIVGTPGIVNTDSSSNLVYPSCAPDGVDDLVLTFGACIGGFSLADLTAGNPTPIKRKDSSGTGAAMRIFDTGVKAVTSPGQTINVGYTEWKTASIPVRAGA